MRGEAARSPRPRSALRDRTSTRADSCRSRDSRPDDAERQAAPASSGGPIPRWTPRRKSPGRPSSPTTSSCPGCSTASCSAPSVAHARIVEVDVSRRPRALRVSSRSPRARTSRSPSASFRSRRTSTRSARDRVRFVGDPVAAVAAVDEDAALRRARRDRRRVRDRSPDRLHRGGRRDPGAADPRLRRRGQLPQARLDGVRRHGGGLRARPTGSTTTSSSTRATRTCRSSSTRRWRDFGPDGKLTLWTSTQTPHYVHRALAKVLEMPPPRIRVIATPNGGGFGGKSDPFNHEIVVAHLSRVTGRPVKICLTREEVFYCHRGRHPTLMRVQTGVRKDGGITAMHFQTILDGGGYGSYGVASTYYTGALQTVTYRDPGATASTARASSPTSRPAAPSAATARRSRASRSRRSSTRSPCDLGLDPAEMRKAHLQPPELADRELPAGRLDGPGRLHRQGRRGLRLEGAARQGCRPGAASGLACSSYICGAGLPIYWNSMPQSGVQLKLDRGGGVTVFCGSTDIGQGSDSILAYIVAEVLGIDPFDIRVVTGDTDLTPVDLGSYSSRVTLMTGNAALQAAERARELLVGGRGREARRSRRRASALAEGRVVRRRGPGDAGWPSPTRSSLPSRSSARSARSAPTRRRPRRDATGAPAWGPRRRTPTRPRSSRSRWIRRPGSTRSRRSGSRTTWASASTRSSSSARSRGRSTWAWARR